ncbi:MAG: coproporphyrinogen III oxidase family protein, partial [Candidatus Thermofonsia bacterium]
MLNSYSLYLHIPFCGHRCSYCDFNTYTTLFDLVQPYAEALCTEMRQVADAAAEPLPVHTIFFGGGTPSLMPVDAMKLILETAASVF